MTRRRPLTLALTLAAFLAVGTAPAATPQPGEALRAAADRGDLTYVRSLVAHGADVNARDADGTTALGHALRSFYGKHTTAPALLRRAGGRE